MRTEPHDSLRSRLPRRLLWSRRGERDSTEAERELRRRLLSSCRERSWRDLLGLRLRERWEDFSFERFGLEREDRCDLCLSALLDRDRDRDRRLRADRSCLSRSLFESLSFSLSLLEAFLWCLSRSLLLLRSRSLPLSFSFTPSLSLSASFLSRSLLDSCSRRALPSPSAFSLPFGSRTGAVPLLSFTAAPLSGAPTPAFSPSFGRFW